MKMRARYEHAMRALLIRILASLAEETTPSLATDCRRIGLSRAQCRLIGDGPEIVGCEIEVMLDEEGSDPHGNNHENRAEKQCHTGKARITVSLPHGSLNSP
jgi:hypothetical protein